VKEDFPVPVVAAEAAAGTPAVAVGRAAASIAADRILDIVVELEQHSMPPIAGLALAAATADTVHTRATASSRHSVHLLTWLRTAPATFACSAAATLPD